MKRVILLSVSLFLSSQVFVAQDFNKLIKEFSQTEGVTKVKLNGLTFGLIKMFMPKDAKKEIKMLKSAEVFMSDNLEAEQIKYFADNLKSIKDGKGFETLVTIKDGNDNVTVALKRKKDTITSMLVFVMDETDIVIVRLKGKIKEADINKLMDEYVKN